MMEKHAKKLLNVVFLFFVAFGFVAAWLPLAEGKGVVVVGLFLGAFLGLYFTRQRDLGAALLVAVTLSAITTTLLGTSWPGGALTGLLVGVVIVSGGILFHQWAVQKFTSEKEVSGDS